MWGPMYHCPALEHVGTIGDSGKWVCGVQTLLQRCAPIGSVLPAKSCFDVEPDVRLRVVTSTLTWCLKCLCSWPSLSVQPLATALPASQPGPQAMTL